MYKFFSPKEWHKKTVKFLHNQKEHQGNHLKNEYLISTKRTQKQITSPQHLKKKLLWDIYIYIYKRSELEDFNLVLTVLCSGLPIPTHPNPYMRVYVYIYIYICIHTHPLSLRQQSKNFFSAFNLDGGYSTKH